MTHISSALSFIRRHPVFFWAWGVFAAVLIGTASLLRGFPAGGDIILFLLIPVIPAYLIETFGTDRKEAKKADQVFTRRKSLATRAYTVIMEGSRKHPLLSKGGERAGALVSILLAPSGSAIHTISELNYWNDYSRQTLGTRCDTHQMVLQALRVAGFHNPDHVWFDINTLALHLCEREPDFPAIVNLIDDIDSFFARVAQAPETTAQ